MSNPPAAASSADFLIPLLCTHLAARGMLSPQAIDNMRSAALNWLDKIPGFDPSDRQDFEKLWNDAKSVAEATQR